ncbi:hypothetical protein [Wolbachia pipientis]|uniref:hypothetical protein n=1 Tax=Wolbachia pipientis TaxID=955 RepID=UPI00164A6272|nr:hypothetical protein [Wolbachia pipientis]
MILTFSKWKDLLNQIELDIIKARDIIQNVAEITLLHAARNRHLGCSNSRQKMKKSV